jgi:mannosyl-oligosaccharide alpha-1,2-mannosidase
MFLRRYKWLFFLIIAVIFVVTIAPLPVRFAPSRSPVFPVNDHKHPIPSTIDSTGPIGGFHACPTTPPTQALNPDTRGRFNWRSVSTHHPIVHYSQLPSGEPSPRPSVQTTFKAVSTEVKNRTATRKDAVREVFKRCWTSYKDLA